MTKFRVHLIKNDNKIQDDDKNDDKNASLRYNLSLFDTTELICFVLRREVWRNTI